MRKRLYQILISKQLAAALFAAVCIFSIPGTFTEERYLYSGIIISVIFGLMGLNLLFCTLERARVLSKPVILMHIGGLVVLVSGVISSFGFLATVNIYEGNMTDKAYRWDIKQDVPLGVDLAVKKINTEYYPVPVKVGVKRGEEKVGLFELKTGESFSIGDYSIKAENIELPSESLSLSIFQQNNFIGSANTSGTVDLPDNFPYRFVLVAFQDPRLKRVWVDLSISDGNNVIAEGSSEVNSPFKWNGLNFYHTEINSDKYGFKYAGMQVTRDPGKPYVFFGFSIMGIGCLMYFLKK
ncbi:MAG: ResB-like family cytochrome C biogenesis protein, partial [Nitrospirae bacterium GWC2_42_7]